MFDAKSRYARTDTAVYTDASGRQIAYVKRRFLPRGEDLQLLVEVTVTESDRLDLISQRTLGSAEASWWICDANDAMHPDELLADPGEKLRVPVPKI